MTNIHQHGARPAPGATGMGGRDYKARPPHFTNLAADKTPDNAKMAVHKSYIGPSAALREQRAAANGGLPVVTPKKPTRKSANA